jgi:TolA-binding protein
VERELAQLRLEITDRENQVEHLLAHEQLRKVDRAEAALALAGVTSKVDPVERAAAAVVAQGDRLRETGDGSRAEASYASVVEHFPKTASAAVAQQRLDNIRKDG